jgi:signal transduction histidine kinase/ActR/RegA family two-component response regulator
MRSSSDPPQAREDDASADEEASLRSVAMQNAQAILLARRRAEQDLLGAKEALERKTQELAQSLSIMRATLDSTWDGILVTSDDGRVTGYNQKYVDMWRIPPATMTPGDHASLLAFTARQFADPEQFVTRVRAIYDAPARESFDLLELSDGRVLERFSKTLRVGDGSGGRVWSFRDITEQRKAEDALRDETRMLELLNRTGTTLAGNLDLHVLVQAITDAATQLSGARFGAFFYNTADERGDAFLLYTLSGAPRDAFAKFGQPRSTSLFGPTFRGDAVIRCHDVLADPRYGKLAPHHGMPSGHPAVRSYLAVPVTSRSGEPIGGLFFGHPDAGVFTERTERLVVGVAAQAGVAIDNARLYESASRAAEERRQLLDSERSARSEAERMSEMKDEFLATLSHELRTPLSAILGWSQVLRHGGDSGENLRKGLEAIERNARVQTKLIEDLLDMSRITSGKVRLDVQPVQPAAFVEAAIETVRHAADAKGIRLEKALDPLAGPICGDPGRLQQVIWNLLSNAIKFTPRGGRVHVHVQRAESQVEIAVTDTGIGIDTAFLELVFDRFRQADHSTTRRYGGLGLGLSIVKHLVELHGGTVRAQSAGADRGATFSLRLPVVAVHRASDDDLRFESTHSNALPVDFKPLDLSGVTVLIVDDEPDARLLLERVLSDCNADVLVAATGETALPVIEQRRPHVLVSDIGMPGMDGYELLRRVRALGEARGGRLPAIALTAFARSEDRTRALRAGFQVHVSKPVEPSELVATVASIVGRTGEVA